MYVYLHTCFYGFINSNTHDPPCQSALLYEKTGTRPHKIFFKINMYYETTATTKIQSLTKRIRAVQGGTSASKTISILIYLIALAQSDSKATLTSVVSESFPHLKRGVIRNFIDILTTHGYYKDQNWNRTDFIYTFETGSQIEFFSADQPDKTRGPRRDRLFINEANNVPKDVFDQLEVRTKEFIFLDWNPTYEFWYYTDVESQRDDCERIILTYLDNEALSPEIVQSIEQRKDNKQWWPVYGLGQLGEVTGRIYSGWKFVDEVPHTGRLEVRGLDFGYSTDPSAIVSIYYQDGGYILDENLFQKGMSNKQLADTFLNLNLPQSLIIADSAEPKSIDEIYSYGLNIQACEKGPDSVRNGIQIVQDQRISVTKRSVNIIDEYRKYMWKTDRDGVLISPNEPEHTYSHTMDAIRYAISSLKKKKVVSNKASAPLLPYYGDRDVAF